NDAFSREDMDNWEKRNKNLLNEEDQIEYYCEPKLDGLAIELTYEEGILKIGSTRGDGMVGENVTQNIKTIESIPLKIKEKNLIVRGEAVINKKDFEKTNKDRLKNSLPPYANPRNLAAGSIRQLDPSITKEAATSAIHLVYLDDALEHLPNGIDTDFTQASFSEGQLQLLSIARAIAAEPRILLLDEITASLDSATENCVLLALNQASQGRTVISISHRLNEAVSQTRTIQISSDPA
ncbi:MAG: ATP-binding cassette domain-containing protein, partial [Erysipelotrichia bacterium]|nr:ATP-binding cassette domain-containing protein [Erysipelotrichia bacterium]